MITADPSSASLPAAAKAFDADRLGRVGVWTRFGLAAAQDARAAVGEIEQLGYGSVWFGESPKHKEAFSHAALLLAATSKLIIGTGIANIWARDPTAMANAAATLGEAFPGRFVLGMGVSHAPQVTDRGHQYSRPVEHMASYLAAMDDVTYLAPPPVPRVPKVLAALGPRMLELASTRADGAHPYLVTPRHTAMARSILGPRKLLVPEQKVILERDPEVARASARKHLRFYITLPNYARSIESQGLPATEFEKEISDRVVDELIAWGPPAAIGNRVRQHLDAGATSVLIQILSDGPNLGVDELRALAPELIAG